MATRVALSLVQILPMIGPQTCHLFTKPTFTECRVSGTVPGSGVTAVSKTDKSHIPSFQGFREREGMQEAIRFVLVKLYVENVTEEK